MYLKRLTLDISEDIDFQIHLSWAKNSSFVNSYFEVGLEAWDANMDVQSVLSKREVISNMCAYLSKTKEGCSNAMK